MFADGLRAGSEWNTLIFGFIIRNATGPKFIYGLEDYYHSFFVHRTVNKFKIHLETFRKYFLSFFFYDAFPPLSPGSQERWLFSQQFTQNYG